MAEDRTHSTASLLRALVAHAAKVREQAAFLRLKQSELRPGDEVSFFGLLQAKEQLALESSLLGGHLHMLKAQIGKSNQKDSREVRRTITHVQTILRNLPPL